MGLFKAAKEVGKYKPLQKNKKGLIAETFSEGFKAFREGLHIFKGKKKGRS